MTVTTNAEIDGDPQVYDTVEVEGLLVGPGLTLLAREIEVGYDGEVDERRDERDHVELSGVIADLAGAQTDIDILSAGDVEGPDLAGSVTVTLSDGTSFIIGEDTEIEGTLQIGVDVEMEIETIDGIRYVIEIEVEDDEEGREDSSDTGKDREEQPAAADGDSGSGNGGEEDGHREDPKDEPVPAADGGETRVRLEAELSGASLGTGEGEADWRERLDPPNLPRTRLSIEIEGGPPGATLFVTVCGTDLGEITLNGDGNFDLNLDSEDDDTVPVCGAGGEVKVGGVTIGSFADKDS